MLRTIKFHGFMAKKYGKEVTLAGDSIQKLMAGLISRFGPKFKEDIRTNDWHLVRGDADAEKPDEVHEAELGLKLTNQVLHFVPVVVNAAKKYINIIVGVILVIAGSFIPGAQALVPIGYSMIVGGVVNLLFAPKIPQMGLDSQDTGSYVYNGAVNITYQGGVKPIIYGRVQRAGAVVISTDFSTDKITNNTTTDPGNVDTTTTEYVIDLP